MKNILEGKVATAAKKSTGKYRNYPCKSARLGINGIFSGSVISH
jgi:hypothetical protein